VPLQSHCRSVRQTHFLGNLLPSSSSFPSLALLGSTVAQKNIIFDFSCSRPHRASRITYFYVHNFPLDFLSLQLNTFFRPLGENLSGTRRTCRRKPTWASESSYGERLRDSPSGAIIMFHDRKHSFDGIVPQSVRRNEKQVHLGSNQQMLERRGNSEIPRCPIEGHRQTLGKSLLGLDKVGLLCEPSLREKLRPPNKSTAVRIDDVVPFSSSIVRTSCSLLREYTFPLRPFRPKEFSSTGKTNPRPSASYRSLSSGNVVVLAISVEDGCT
jgi:hypothetical protein